MTEAAFTIRHLSKGEVREYQGLGPRVEAMNHADALECLRMSHWGRDLEIPSRVATAAATIIADDHGVDLCTNDGACCDCDDINRDPRDPPIETGQIEWALSEAQRGNASEALIRLSYALHEYPDAVRTLDLIRNKIA
jgi:hypothetical protein